MVADGALVERALDALIRKGKVPGGKAYGYDLVTAATGERQINPAPAASGQAISSCWPTSIAASSTWSWSKRVPLRQSPERIASSISEIATRSHRGCFGARPRTPGWAPIANATLARMLLLPTDGTRLPIWEPGISVRRRFLRSSRTSSCLSVILAGASERKAQWRNGKEPDLGEDDFEAPAVHHWPPVF